jgi:hypothetical protein
MVSPRRAGRHGGVDLGQTLGFWNLGIASLNALAQPVETSLQPADPLKQARIHQGGHGLAIPLDHDAVVAVLHLVEHVAQVLAEADGRGFANHGLIMPTRSMGSMKSIGPIRSCGASRVPGDRRGPRRPDADLPSDPNPSSGSA